VNYPERERGDGREGRERGGEGKGKEGKGKGMGEVCVIAVGGIDAPVIWSAIFGRFAALFC